MLSCFMVTPEVVIRTRSHTVPDKVLEWHGYTNGKYTVGEILEIMEGTLCPVACLESKKNECPRRSFCKTLPMWKEYNKLVHNFFFDKKLSDLINN